MKRVGEIIREARLRQGISQDALAAAIGLKCQGHMSRIESGRQSLPPRYLALAAQILKIAVEDLIQGVLREQEIKIKRKGGL